MLVQRRFQVTSLLTGMFLCGIKERYKINLPQIYPQLTYTTTKIAKNFFAEFPEFFLYQHLKCPSSTDFYSNKSAVGTVKEFICKGRSHPPKSDTTSSFWNLMCKKRRRNHINQNQNGKSPWKELLPEL